MLQNIPTHVIAGPLGAGKTSLIRHLLANKPADERWAVLINEFGQIGLDAALLTTGADGIALGEVAGGCLCCVNGVPFQIGLGRLLRKARPDRLLIEPSGLGHPAQLLEQLRQAPWQEVLRVMPALLVLDAQALAAGQPLPDTQRQALEHAGLLVLNKSEGLDAAARQAVLAALPERPMVWCSQGRLPLQQLPGLHVSALEAPSAAPLALPPSLQAAAAQWSREEQPVVLSQASADGWSIGWRWHPSQRFDRQRVEHWLGVLSWRRAKLVIHAEEGWQAANALEGGALAWQASEWRQDSRLELIFTEAQDAAALQRGLAGCRLG
ncbi:GTP-binding protein [Pseudomonas sp. DTU_2021_1001937_2_SI_NGA_ILE_001]|uniref:CobW family GTP-binding protein n=1 Tax=Pseudomonas sp. DTU_2021_1001937_2_SI_NGA_ILE_001 TaxID=3077589 RepID=UPI0028FC15D9|nr:GTP-binding protein [Pseudomonas sp. DTU_2021_1001937_2_SI_NGA_ILE_001]WNW12556.1 GTP-binding protein [Pseudomonas sp. DTU_2021_1001937_2_SI_NGA_ILE_001]